MTTQNPLSADWNDIAATVADALDCGTDAERIALIDARCADRPAMRAEVMGLLGHAGEGKKFIVSGGALQHVEISASKLLQSRADSGTPAIGSRLDAWTILSELGRGGMGVVFHVAREINAQTNIATHLTTRQEGALKLMRVNVGDAQALARFAREQKILAQLNHPNIARLIDGGAAPDGSPYLVMEYAAGQSLDLWCEAAQPNFEARLQVMQKICAAVQYAHQLLVVHRDLKPSNIIIQADGTPKLLDFGIAKLLSDDASSDHTAEAARVYTPWYASPEHLRGETVSTASDVYSLGVILYGLLTGKRPYKLRNTGATTATAVDVMHAVLETDATRPSLAIGNSQIEAAWDDGDIKPAGFAAALAGDLDTIVLKALAKEPLRRYATPDALAADLQRYLSHEPISAAKPSAWYRSKKFARRNRAGVAAAAVAASALFIGTGVAIWQAREAIKQRNIAQARFDDSREQATTVLFDYLDAVQYLPGSTPIRKRMAEDAQKYLDKLALDTEGDVKANAGLLTTLATALHRLSFVQYNGFNRPHLDQRDAALANATRSLKIHQQLIAAGIENEELRFEYGQALTQVGGIHIGKVTLEKALSYFEQCAASYGIAVKNDRADQRNGIELARCNLRLSAQLHRANPYLQPAPISDRYLKHVKLAREALNAVAVAKPDNKELPHVWEWVLRLEAQQLSVAGDWLGALQPNLTKLAIMKKLRGAEPNNSAYNTDTAGTYHLLSIAYRMLGKFDDALNAANEAAALTASISQADPSDKMFARRHAQSLLYRAWALAGLAQAGNRSANSAAVIAFMQAKSATEAILKNNANDAAAAGWLVEIAYRETEFIAQNNTVAALVHAKKTLLLAAAQDLPTNQTIAPTVRLAQVQNLAAILALKNKDGALSAQYDAQLRDTLARIAVTNVTPPTLADAYARLAP